MGSTERKRRQEGTKMNFACFAILSRTNMSYGTLYNGGKCSSLAKVVGRSLV